MTKNENSYNLEDIALSGKNEVMDKSFQDIKNKLDFEKRTVKDSLKLDDLKDLIYDLISRSEKNEPPSRLLTQLGYNFRK